MGASSGVTTEMPQWARATAGSETMALIWAASAPGFILCFAGLEECEAAEHAGAAKMRQSAAAARRWREKFIFWRSVA